MSGKFLFIYKTIEKIVAFVKKVVVCMDDNYFFCSFSCSVRGPLYWYCTSTMYNALYQNHKLTYLPTHSSIHVHFAFSMLLLYLLAGFDLMITFWIKQQLKWSIFLLYKENKNSRQGSFLRYFWQSSEHQRLPIVLYFYKNCFREETMKTLT